VLRRAAAAALLVAAGVIAIGGRPGPAAGIRVLAIVRDLPAGSTLGPADLTTLMLTAVPDGALRAPPQALGHLLSGPVRKGEVLTDVRLLSIAGPSPGPGRVAVPIRPADPGTVDLLSPGVHVAVLSVAENGAATVLAADAVVLAIPPASKSDAAKRLVVLSVPRAAADRVTAASVNGAIAMRFA
jgi:pilus assembly protein CpaB